MTTRHILKTDFGVICTLALNEETGSFNCFWEGLPKHPTRTLRDKIAKAYLPWRDQLLKDWSQKTGKTVLLITAR